jgi:hypothetical protein
MAYAAYRVQIVSVFEDGVREDHAKRIQRSWRRYKIRRDYNQKQTALRKEQEESVQRAMKAQETLQANSSLLHRVMRISMDAARSAIKLAQSVTETVQPMEVKPIPHNFRFIHSFSIIVVVLPPPPPYYTQLVTDEDERRLIISVTKYQTLSMQQGKNLIFRLNGTD